MPQKELYAAVDISQYRFQYNNLLMTVCMPQSNIVALCLTEAVVQGLGSENTAIFYNFLRNIPNVHSVSMTFVSFKLHDVIVCSSVQNEICLMEVESSQIYIIIGMFEVCYVFQFLIP